MLRVGAKVLILLIVMVLMRASLPWNFEGKSIGKLETPTRNRNTIAFMVVPMV
jgi:hypothetical protein